MLQEIVLKETKSHTHLTPQQAEWYANLLKRVENLGISIDDLWFWNRMFANYYFRKRSYCNQCYDTFMSKYSV